MTDMINETAQISHRRSSANIDCYSWHSVPLSVQINCFHKAWLLEIHQKIYCKLILRRSVCFQTPHIFHSSGFSGVKRLSSSLWCPRQFSGTLSSKKLQNNPNIPVSHARGVSVRSNRMKFLRAVPQIRECVMKSCAHSPCLFRRRRCVSCSRRLRSDHTHTHTLLALPSRSWALFSASFSSEV